MSLLLRFLLHFVTRVLATAQLVFPTVWRLLRFCCALCSPLRAYKRLYIYSSSSIYYVTSVTGSGFAQSPVGQTPVTKPLQNRYAVTVCC